MTSEETFAIELLGVDNFFVLIRNFQILFQRSSSTFVEVKGRYYSHLEIIFGDDRSPQEAANKFFDRKQADRKSYSNANDHEFFLNELPQDEGDLSKTIITEEEPADVESNEIQETTVVHPLRRFIRLAGLLPYIMIAP
ncbi:18521_t:CDS:2 [Gigaspora rosea]|nr:18521_t:CDS:2 [Gigaspora rosea]